MDCFENTLRLLHLQDVREYITAIIFRKLPSDTRLLYNHPVFCITRQSEFFVSQTLYSLIGWYWYGSYDWRSYSCDHFQLIYLPIFRRVRLKVDRSIKHRTLTKLFTVEFKNWIFLNLPFYRNLQIFENGFITDFIAWVIYSIKLLLMCRYQICRILFVSD